MRRVLMMVFAVAAFMGLGTATSVAQHGASGCDKSASAKKNGKPACPKPKKCKEGEVRKNGKCVSKPAKCKEGEVRKNGKCVAKPVKCTDGEEKVNGKCVAKCRDHEYRDKDGKCQPKPPLCKDDEINVGGKCVPRPKAGPCAKADLVLLEDLLKGTGALLCVYLGDNAPHASNQKGGDCPGALLALPVDNLIGACLFLPPADVGGSKTSGMPLPLPVRTETTGDSGAAAAGAGLDELSSTLTGLLGLG